MKPMRAFLRYFRLIGALGRYGMARELAFRGNFIAKITVEVLWLGILVIFYRTIFAHTENVAGWDEAEYLFFVGCYFAMEGLIETLFLENCSEFSELIRSGDLDFFLIKPIDEQFLVTCRAIDWSTAPNVIMGFCVMIIALVQKGWSFDLLQVVLFVLLFLCGAALAYSFLLTLTSTAVWFVRNQSLLELWWLFTSLMRYPREIFSGALGGPLNWFFTFIVPVMLVINVPARTMLRAFEPRFALYTVVTTVVMLFISRKVFRYALRSYRSASS
jgi:viologen exporter family transport system permease protein